MPACLFDQEEADQTDETLRVSVLARTITSATFQLLWFDPQKHTITEVYAFLVLARTITSTTFQLFWLGPGNEPKPTLLCSFGYGPDHNQRNEAESDFGSGPRTKPKQQTGTIGYGQLFRF